jgi:4,4'-diaponeurosporenoate glycosyltransferase
VIVLFVLCALGLPAGLLLLVRVPLCSPAGAAQAAGVSVVIPARNEEHNLPPLLSSLLAARPGPNEVIVVDDHSADGTAAVATAHGTRVLAARPLPAGWTGKTWSCAQGAEAARADLLLFLDADTWLAPGGFERLTATFAALGPGPVALSVLPYHVMHRTYEELSLFFNLLMAFGAGGFGLLGRGRLFGQSLLIPRTLYAASGGHAAVRRQILENVALSRRVEAAGGRCVCRGGRGVLQVRMFPEGFSQLCEGWTKAFADGAAASDERVLGMAIFWLSALCATFLLVLMASGPLRVAASALYLCFAMQVAWCARQIGAFRLLTCALYPIPLLFFFALFTRSALRRSLGQKVTWRGRQL